MPPSAHVHCPPPDTLRTGDLLFPRAPHTEDTNTWSFVGLPPSETSFSLGTLAPGLTIRALLAQKAAEFEQAEPNASQPVHALLQKYAAHYSGDLDFSPATPSPKGQINLDDWRVMSLLLKIMQADMGELFHAWLDMTVTDFVKSDLGQFLFELLKSGTTTEENFFVGHLAMVFREHQGQVVTNDQAEGAVYVIEANITDYSHYRVAIHPYWVDEVGSPTADEWRGWANRRMAQGQKVWAARPAALVTDTPDSALLRQHLVTQAKRWLGRPYGFFDHPTFGDPDRMYCAEYLYRVFWDASEENPGGQTIGLDGNRNWGWMRSYLKASKQQRLFGLVDALMKEHHFPASKPFFVLTPAMIWCSPAMAQHASPQGEEPYSTCT